MKRILFFITIILSIAACKKQDITTDKESKYNITSPDSLYISNYDSVDINNDLLYDFDFVISSYTVQPQDCDPTPENPNACDTYLHYEISISSRENSYIADTTNFLAIVCDSTPSDFSKFKWRQAKKEYYLLCDWFGCTGMGLDKKEAYLPIKLCTGSICKYGWIFIEIIDKKYIHIKQYAIEK